MSKDEALKLALEFVEANHSGGPDAFELITAIKQALAAPVQEPVAWFKHGPYEDGEPLSVVFENPHDDVCYSPLGFIDTPPAAHPATEKSSAVQPAPVQKPEYVYTCNGCDTLYREDDVSCDCTVNGLMEFTRHILAPDATPPAQEFVCSTGLCHYKPAAQRPWVGLTDERVRQLCGSVPSMKAAVREAEAELKEKNT